MEYESTKFPIVTKSLILKAAHPSKRILLGGIGLAVLGLLPFVIGCDLFSPRATEDSHKIKESRTMEMTQTRKDHATAIPPMDISAPSRTETATFALG
jgi:hypothetical protein